MSLDRDNIELFERLTRVETKIEDLERNTIEVRTILDNHKDDHTKSLMDYLNKAGWFVAGIIVSVIGFLLSQFLS